mmetsp:Transcript_10309/g.17672  ORF Transcript_10309/g.17672 Transcript_10309/m.17672 type:complete len:208 (+) Transcript_10309:815-1438(+)
MFIRLVDKMIADMSAPGANESASGGPLPMFDFLEASLRHHRDVVVLEAARVIVNIPDVTTSELQPVVNVLQLFLVQSRVAMRFAAMQLLNRIAVTHLEVLSHVKEDMEQLLQDSNRSFSTLVITALLRTGSESSVERLLKQIQAFLPELGDEFKIQVVKSIHQLCLKYPSKQYALLNFLGSALREEGGFSFKKTIVDTYMMIMAQVP